MSAPRYRAYQPCRTILQRRASATPRRPGQAARVATAVGVAMCYSGIILTMIALLGVWFLGWGR